MRNTFINTLTTLAEADPRIWLLCGDLGYSVLERFAERFPDRYINVGVAEQNMMGIAAGLALSGNTVFTYSIANFPTMRCLEQIRNDICYHNANVKIVAVGGGMAYGAAGYTHYGLEDLAVMRSLPNLTVAAPGDPIETRRITEAISTAPGPCYLRLGKGGEPTVHAPDFTFDTQSMITVRAGISHSEIAILSTGAMLPEALRAADLLPDLSVNVISVPFIKPLDSASIQHIAAETRLIVTVEEHSITGGLGGAVAEVLAELDSPHARLIRCGVTLDSSYGYGTQAYMRTMSGLDAVSIAARIRSALPLPALSTSTA